MFSLYLKKCLCVIIMKTAVGKKSHETYFVLSRTEYWFVVFLHLLWKRGELNCFRYDKSNIHFTIQSFFLLQNIKIYFITWQFHLQNYVYHFMTLLIAVRRIYFFRKSFISSLKARKGGFLELLMKKEGERRWGKTLATKSNNNLWCPLVSN